MKRKLDDIETREFIKRTAVPPAQRFRQIQDINRKNQYNRDPFLNALSFRIADQVRFY